LGKAPALWSKSTNAVKWHMPSVDVRHVKRVANVGLANCSCVLKGGCEARYGTLAEYAIGVSNCWQKLRMVDLQLSKQSGGIAVLEIVASSEALHLKAACYNTNFKGTPWHSYLCEKTHQLFSMHLRARLRLAEPPTGGSESCTSHPTGRRPLRSLPLPSSLTRFVPCHVGMILDI